MRYFGVSACLGGSICVALLSGCEALSGYSVETVLNAAHHGARGEDGALPDYGGDMEARVFTNDLGWKIVLSEGTIVTTAATIEPCEGDGVQLGMPFGPYPESLLETDATVTDFALRDLKSGEYCNLIVEYGRYQAAVAAMAEEQPFPVPPGKDLEGSSIYLAGTASLPDGMGGMTFVNFAFRSEQTIRVELSMKTLEDGGPWTITGDEPNGRSLTVAKTYDEFFTGVDFNKVDRAAFEAELPARLAAQTRLVLGTSI
ncbi:MAG: hypothetical protein JNK56_11890 [Myxococcales bacterium]|nr:hypothetical protein [Myxococcales bacterium]